MAVHPELVPLGAAATPQEHRNRAVLQRKPQPAAADHRRLQPGRSRTCRARAWEYTARVPIPTFGPITWLDPAGDNHYNGLSARVEHRFTKGLYVLNSFTWGKAMGDSEQALEYLRRLLPGQSAEHSQPGRGKRSFQLRREVQQRHQRGLPASLRQGPQIRRQHESRAGCVLGGWEINTINTAHTGTPLDVIYGATGANIVSALSNDYRGQPFLRPNVTGSAVSQSRSAMLNTYFAGYTFTTPPASAPFGERGPQCVPRSELRAVGLFGRQELPDPRDSPAAVPVGVLQRPESHEFRHPEHADDQRRLRDHPHHLSVAAEPVRAEAAFLRTWPPMNADKRR